MPGGIDLWGLQFAPPPLPSLPEGSPPRFNERFPSFSNGLKQNTNEHKINNNSTLRGGLEVLTGWGPASGTIDLPKGTSDSIIDEFHVPSSAGHNRWFTGLAESLANIVLHFGRNSRTKDNSSSDESSMTVSESVSPRVIRIEQLEDVGFRSQEGIDTVKALSKFTFSNDSVSIREEDYERKNDGKKRTIQPITKKINTK